MCIRDRLYERNFDTLYRVCYMYMKNIQDTEDAVHNAFLKAIETRKQFESENHEKAWLIRVASNICKNMLKACLLYTSYHKSVGNAFQHVKILAYEQHGNAFFLLLVEHMI